MVYQGDLHAARALLSDLVTEAEAAGGAIWSLQGLTFLGWTLTFLGELDGAREAAEASIVVGRDMGVAVYEGVGYWCLSLTAIAAGDVAALRQTSEAFSRSSSFLPSGPLSRSTVWP